MRLTDRHSTLVTYLKMKVEEADWHAVSDAANDLRVLEVQTQTEPDKRPTPITAESANSLGILMKRCGECQQTSVCKAMRAHWYDGNGWSCGTDRCLDQ